MDDGGRQLPPPGGQPPGSPGSAGGWQPPQPAGWGQQPAAPHGRPYPAPSGPSNDPLAIASFAVGLLSIVGCFCLSFFVTPLCIVGIALGLVAMSNIRKKPETLRGREMAIAGVALSVLTLVLVAMTFVVPFGLMGVGLLLDGSRHR